VGSSRQGSGKTILQSDEPLPVLGLVIGFVHADETSRDDPGSWRRQASRNSLPIPMALVFLNIRSCSECSSDADCGAKLCNPTFILSSQSGYRSCVDPGGVALGAACNKDATCTSGICAEVMIKWPALPLASALNAELMPIV
jgi:hypothetical protein